LREDLGEESFVGLIGKCVEDVLERLGKLETAAATDDRQQIRELAHQLKGLFAQFGATEAARAAATAEACGDEPLAPSLAALLQSAATVLARFRDLGQAG
jgi:HPt (histidine-containing phosphotransfer) domain-containing protein